MNVIEAKTHFSGVVDQVEQGETVLICKRNVLVAKLTAVDPVRVFKEKHHTVIGWAKGTGACIHADLTEPALAETEWTLPSGASGPK